MPQQNLRAMLLTKNCLSLPYSKGFSARVTIHPKTHTPPQYLTNLEQKALSGFCLELSEVKSLSRARLFATPWTAAFQAPLSMGFPGKSTGVGCHCLLRQLRLLLKRVKISEWVTMEYLGFALCVDCSKCDLK